MTTTTTAFRAWDAADLPLFDIADTLLLQADAALSIAWEVCDHSIRLDVALHDIRCAIDRIQQAREAIAGAARDIAVDIAADSGQHVGAAVRSQQRTADTMQQQPAADRIETFRNDLANALESSNWPGDDAAEVRTADAERLAALLELCKTVEAAAYLIVRKKRSW